MESAKVLGKYEKCPSRALEDVHFSFMSRALEFRVPRVPENKRSRENDDDEEHSRKRQAVDTARREASFGNFYLPFITRTHH